MYVFELPYKINSSFPETAKLAKKQQKHHLPGMFDAFNFSAGSFVCHMIRLIIACSLVGHDYFDAISIVQFVFRKLIFIPIQNR